MPKLISEMAMWIIKFSVDVDAVESGPLGEGLDCLGVAKQSQKPGTSA